MDQTSLLVLATLQQLVGTNEDLQDAWFFPITVSNATGLDLAVISDEYDILAADGLIETRQAPDRNRDGRPAKLTARGAAVLAQDRKHLRAFGKATDRAETPPSEGTIAIRKDDGQTYDAFLSYASEDRDYALRLREALTKANISVWMDTEMKIGDPVLPTIEWGIKTFPYGILLISAAYIRKPYPKAEFDALIKRQIESRGGFAVLPLLHDGLSQEQLAEFSPVVSTLRNVSTTAPISEIAQEIARVVSPPSVTIATPLAPAAAEERQQRGVPTDALPEDARLALTRPRLNIAGFELDQRSPKEMNMKYVIQNVGNGTASKISTFLPGVVIERLPGPITAGGNLTRQVKLSERQAYTDLLPIYAQVVIEFEDQAGNVYRQYGRPIQKHTIHGRYSYAVEELDRPYLVPQRIVPENVGAGFQRRPT